MDLAYDMMYGRMSSGPNIILCKKHGVVVGKRNGACPKCFYAKRDTMYIHIKSEFNIRSR